MASRPGTRERSTPESLGVGTIARSETSETNFNPSAVAEEVAEDITFSMFDNVLGHEEALERMKQLTDENNALKSENESLQARLASSQTEGKDSTIEDLKKQNEVLMQQVHASAKELES